jgi:hypothetical protein
VREWSVVLDPVKVHQPHLHLGAERGGWRRAARDDHDAAARGLRHEETQALASDKPGGTEEEGDQDA